MSNLTFGRHSVCITLGQFSSHWLFDSNLPIVMKSFYEEEALDISPFWSQHDTSVKICPVFIFANDREWKMWLKMFY